MALIGYCTCETLLSFIGWVGLVIEPGGDIQKGQGADFCMMERQNMLQLKLFSQVFFIPTSLYPLMYLDKKRNKEFFFLRGQSWALSPLCFSLAAMQDTELMSSVGLGIKLQYVFGTKLNMYQKLPITESWP